MPVYPTSVKRELRSKTTTIKHTVLESVVISSQFPGQLSQLMDKHSMRFQLQKQARTVLDSDPTQMDKARSQLQIKLATTRAITRDQQCKEQQAQVDSQRLQQLRAAGYPHTTTTMANLQSWLKQLRSERKWRGSMARKHQNLLEQCLEYAQEQQQVDQAPATMLIEDSPSSTTNV